MSELHSMTTITQLMERLHNAAACRSASSCRLGVPSLVLIASPYADTGDAVEQIARQLQQDGLIEADRKAPSVHFTMQDRENEVNRLLDLLDNLAYASFASRYRGVLAVDLTYMHHAGSRNFDDLCRLANDRMDDIAFVFVLSAGMPASEVTAMLRHMQQCDVPVMDVVRLDKPDAAQLRSELLDELQARGYTLSADDSEGLTDFARKLAEQDAGVPVRTLVNRAVYSALCRGGSRPVISLADFNHALPDRVPETVLRELKPRQKRTTIGFGGDD